jgi:hypothetical protein
MSPDLLTISRVRENSQEFWTRIQDRLKRRFKSVKGARISLDRTKMQVEDRMVDLSPGMAVTVVERLFFRLDRP